MTYTKIGWEDSPSTATAISATNLEHMDDGIDNALDKTGDTATGIIVAQNNTSYTTKQMRNIFLSTANPVDGTDGSNGDIWIKYEV